MSQINISDLPLNEQTRLTNLRDHKDGLLKEIHQLQNTLSRVNNELAAISVIEDPEERNKLYLIGRKKFNTNPKAGIKYLIEHRLLENDPENIAEFFISCKDLRKQAIGEYLGEKEDFNIKVMEYFIGKQSFRGQPLVPSLRQFLNSFRLPGEAQKIDRLMECFAKKYCEQNPTIFKTSDTCFVLCYSIIMLNTSLHNTSVKEKITLEKFLQMHKDIEGCEDISEDLLLNLYENIRNEPFKSPDEDGNELGQAFYNPDRAGYLEKLNSGYRSWKRRWFVLNEMCLYYFESETDKSPKGIIPLESICVRMVEDKSRPHTFEIYSNASEVIKSCKAEPKGKLVEGRHSVYRLAASTYDEMSAWTNAIQRNVYKNTFFSTLQVRKKKAILSTPIKK
jgi:cytohesin|uniref:Cytohesin-1 n=1 Tax=Panagrolaimus sp. PS1159 TaxID=55785 RepID=A0AC35FJZ0_9BILA